MARPRILTLSPEEMTKLGEEMVQWCLVNKPLHLSQWWSFEKDITDSDWNAIRKLPEFVHYYNKALKIVGMSYINKESKVEPRIKDRWLRVYFKDLKEQEDEDMDAAAKRAKSVEEDKDKNSACVQKLEQLLSEFSSNPDLKSVDINISNDTKS